MQCLVLGLGSGVGYVAGNVERIFWSFSSSLGNSHILQEGGQFLLNFLQIQTFLCILTGLGEFIQVDWFTMQNVNIVCQLCTCNHFRNRKEKKLLIKLCLFAKTIRRKEKSFYNNNFQNSYMIIRARTNLFLTEHWSGKQD